MHPATHVQRQPLKTTATRGCLLLFTLALTACVAASPTPVGIASSPVPFTASPSTTETRPASTQSSPTPSALPPDFWQSLPIIPAAISDRVRDVYRLGLEMGNNPHVFSRIGDCASAAPAFLTGFDQDYDLGEYGYLQPAIDYFSGSFERPSVAAKGGLTSSGLLTTLWTDELCENNETLLACQYRLDGPSFAIISIGTNEAYYIHNNPTSFEINLRLIIEDTIARGIVPILGTKADNFEGDNSINATIALLAMEYELPLWNFWLAAQPLPNQGLIDPAHLSSISYTNFTDFSIPHSLEYGVQMRNLTALQVLHFLWAQLVISDPIPTPTP